MDFLAGGCALVPSLGSEVDWDIQTTRDPWCLWYQYVRISVPSSRSPGPSLSLGFLIHNRMAQGSSVLLKPSYQNV